MKLAAVSPAPRETLPPLPRRRRETVALGPWRLSPAAVAWTLSLLVHGALAVASYLVIRATPLDTSPLFTALGDGSSESGLMDRPGLPDLAPGMPGPVATASPIGAAPAAPSLESDAAQPVDAPAPSPSLPPALDPPAPDAQDAAPPLLADSPLAPAALPVFSSRAPIPDLPAPSPPSNGAAAAASSGAAPGGTSSATAGSPRADGASGSGGMSANDSNNSSGQNGGGGATTGEGGAALTGRAGSPAGVKGGRALRKPEYPALSQRRGEQGTILLELEILADGRLGHVTVLSDPGYPRLVEAAIHSVREEQFVPAIQDGHPVTSIRTIPYRFVLKDGR